MSTLQKIVFAVIFKWTNLSMLESSKSLEPLIVKLFRRASRYSNSTIFSFDGKRYLLGNIASEVICAAEHLSQFKARPGFIVLCLENSPQFAVAFLAGNMCNLNVGVFNAHWPSSLLSNALRILEPDCVIFDKNAVVETNSPNLLIRTIDKKQYDANDFSLCARKLKVDHNIERSFYTGFTSGSTGVPKGFVRSELSWYLSFEADKQEFGFSERDVFICPGNLAHSLFLYAFLRALYGGSQLLAYRKFSPDQIVKDIQTRLATVLFVVPTQLLAICELALKKKVKFDSPRLVLSAGAKLDSAILGVAQEIFPNAEIVEFYGSSEHGYISVNRQSETPPKGSVGRAFSGVQIAVKDSQGIGLKAGQIGQVFVKSAYKFSGYAQAKKQGIRSLPQLHGFIGTGDTGYLDGNGFLHLIGRMDRMIVTSGHNIYPETVESTLLSIKGIRHAAVLSRPCMQRGQRLFAIIQFEQGARLSRRELLKTGRQELPVFAVPSTYYECNDWPMTVSHKTDYQQLQEQASTGLPEVTL